MSAYDGLANNSKVSTFITLLRRCEGQSFDNTLIHYWSEAAADCDLKDFSEESQRTATLYLFEQCGALESILQDDLKGAVLKWRSLSEQPGTVTAEAPSTGGFSLGKLFVLPSFLRALQAGEELVNAVKAKNAQKIINAITVLVVSGVSLAKAYGYTIPFTDDQLVLAVTVVATGLFNIWATLVTSKRVGLSLKRSDSPPPVVDGGGDRSTVGSESGLWFDRASNGNVPVLRRE